MSWFLSGCGFCLLLDSRESVMMLEWKQILPEKPTLSSTGRPDYYGEGFHCGFHTEVFYWDPSWAFNSAAKWWRGIIFQYIKLLLAEQPINPTGNPPKQSRPCRTCLSPRLHRLITFLTFTRERDTVACRGLQKRCSAIRLSGWITIRTCFLR